MLVWPAQNWVTSFGTEVKKKKRAEILGMDCVFDGANVTEWMTKTSVNYSESNRDLRRKMKHSVFVPGPGISTFLAVDRFHRPGVVRMEGRTD